MAREKQDYREQLAYMTERINERYPDNLGLLTAEQVAEIFGVNIKTVYAMSDPKRRDALPRVNVSRGGRKVYRYPVAAVVRFSLG